MVRRGEGVTAEARFWKRRRRGPAGSGQWRGRPPRRPQREGRWGTGRRPWRWEDKAHLSPRLCFLSKLSSSVIGWGEASGRRWGAEGTGGDVPWALSAGGRLLAWKWHDRCLRQRQACDRPGEGVSQPLPPSAVSCWGAGEQAENWVHPGFGVSLYNDCTVVGSLCVK